MLQVLLCVLMNVGIFICFRLFGVVKMNTLQAIIFNYITCVITGLIYIGDTDFVNALSLDDSWLVIAFVLGAVFISTFYLMAITTQKFSITVSSIASKMSLIIPVLVSLFILGIQSKNYTLLNYAGMLLAIVAVFLSAYKERKIETSGLSGRELLLPLLIFILGGLIDSSINYTNHHFLTQREERIFPVIIFASASIFGIIALVVKRQKLHLKSILGGIVLGAVNYFSIYFLLTSLSAFENDGAIVYPLVNVGTILISSFLSILFFNERMSRLNQLGLLVAILAIIFISYQELSVLL